MRIAVVTHYFEGHRGGIEIVAGHLNRELAGAGFDITWLASDASPPPAEHDGLRCVPLAAGNLIERVSGLPMPVPGPLSLLRLVRAVRAADAVLIHDALYPTSIAAFLAAKASRVPVVVVQHVGEVPYRSAVRRAVFAIANRAVAGPIVARAERSVFISEATARHFGASRFRTPPGLIFNGVDTAIFHPPAMPADVERERRRHGLPERSRIALFVGRFVEKKGLQVVERMARLRPDVTFALAGWGPENPAAWALPNVRVFGSLSGPSLASLYRASDALVLPSVGEGFPLVVQEALASGLPVICGQDSAAADPAASDWLESVTVDPTDAGGTAQRFAAALARITARPAAPSEAAARATFARERYSWSRAGLGYAALFRTLAARAA